MKRLSVRARLTLWHSGLLAALVLAFAVAGYVFLRRTELDRVDSTLHEQSEIVTQSMRTVGISGTGRHAADTSRLVNTLHDLRARSLRAWVFDADRRLIVSTAMVHEGEGDAEERRVLGDTVRTADLLAAVTAAAASHGHHVATVRAPSGDIRLFAAPLPADVGPGTIVVSHSLDELRVLLARARNAAILATILAILLSAVAGYALARRSLAPVTQMSHQADLIGAANLHERLPIANRHDELGILAATFNALLDRVSNAFDQQRRFMADASHELRTPVAIMRGEAEVALSGTARTSDDYRDALGIVRDAADRLTRTVNDVFLLARVDAGQVPPGPAPLYIDELVSETCRAMRSLAQPRSIELVVDAPGEVPYTGDEALLGRLVMNLIDNAIKYSPDHSVVHVDVATTPTAITVRVANAGRGIPAEARAHVFDRFFRADAARSRDLVSQGSGSGLGLSIARWIAELHGGQLELTESSAETTVFTLTLPRVPVLHP